MKIVCFTNNEYGYILWLMKRKVGSPLIGPQIGVRLKEGRAAVFNKIVYPN
jgi:hypothetical protein